MGLEDTVNALGKSTKSFVIGIAILILTMFVVIYGISTFYPPIEYEDFCGEFRTQEIIENEAQCQSIGGKWTSQEIKCVTEPCPQGFCERDYSCRLEYEQADEGRARNVFFIAIPLGIIIIALGAFVFHLNSVGVGLMFGGVGTLIYGAGGYWQYSENAIKFLISLIALIVLIFLAYRFNKRK